jgi:hypothetical protein
MAPALKVFLSKNPFFAVGTQIEKGWDAGFFKTPANFSKQFLTIKIVKK